MKFGCKKEGNLSFQLYDGICNPHVIIFYMHQLIGKSTRWHLSWNISELRCSNNKRSFKKMRSANCRSDFAYIWCNWSVSVSNSHLLQIVFKFELNSCYMKINRTLFNHWLPFIILQKKRIFSSKVIQISYNSLNYLFFHFRICIFNPNL